MGRHSLRRLGTIPLIAGAAGSAVAALSLPAVAAPVGRLGCRAFRAAARTGHLSQQSASLPPQRLPLVLPRRTLRQEIPTSFTRRRQQSQDMRRVPLGPAPAARPHFVAEGQRCRALTRTR